MKYRKKPVVIEAFQMTEQRRRDNSEWPQWLNQAWQLDSSTPGSVSPIDYPYYKGNDKLVIRTIEGAMTVDWNDWIIQGVKGELYPCKPDIFAATYEAVVEDTPSLPAVADGTVTIVERLRDVIIEVSGATTEQITNEASFIEDLGFDSLDMVEVVFSVEEEFKIDILDEEAAQIVTVNDAVELIAGKLNRKA